MATCYYFKNIRSFSKVCINFNFHNGVVKCCPSLNNNFMLFYFFRLVNAISYGLSSLSNLFDLRHDYSLADHLFICCLCGLKVDVPWLKLFISAHYFLLFSNLFFYFVFLSFMTKFQSLVI